MDETVYRSAYEQFCAQREELVADLNRQIAAAEGHLAALREMLADAAGRPGAKAVRPRKARKTSPAASAA